MKIYKVTMKSGYEWLLRGDFSQSASPLTACFDPREDDLIWQGTPYQVADASHSQYDAAKLVYEYFDTMRSMMGYEYFDDDGDEVNEVEEEAK
tara:strand:- start:42 stop:320 length:279 start_codon:yes stop_codon:yes gene_type:complete